MLNTDKAGLKEVVKSRIPAAAGMRQDYADLYGLFRFFSFDFISSTTGLFLLLRVPGSSNLKHNIPIKIIRLHPRNL